LTEPAHTGILLLSLYFKRVFAMEAGTIAWLLGLSALFATLGAFTWGKLADRFSPTSLMFLLFPLWSFGLLSAALIPAWGVWILAPGLGVLLAGIWVLLRLVVLEQFHHGPLTLQFTFLALVERTASMLGPLLWSAIAHTFHDSSMGFRVATGSLSFFPVIGFFLLFQTHHFRNP
jgi:MFS-type transporter involved in bile tolerance (Atg22 family)